MLSVVWCFACVPGTEVGCIPHEVRHDTDSEVIK